MGARNTYRDERGRFAPKTKRYIVWADDTLLLFAFIPGDPTPYKCPVMSRYGGEIPSKGRMKMRDWQQEVEKAELCVKTGLPIDVPVQARYYFYLPRPKSRPLRDVWAETSADVDNLAKSTSDALQRRGVLKTDARICELWASKEWVAREDVGLVGVRIELRAAGTPLDYLSDMGERVA